MTGADPAGQMTKAFECLPLSCRNGCRLHCPAHAIASSLRTRNKWVIGDNQISRLTTN